MNITLIKLLLELFGAAPTLFADIEAIVNEVKSHDPRSDKIQNIANNVTNLALAVNSVVTTPNGANGDK